MQDNLQEKSEESFFPNEPEKIAQGFLKNILDKMGYKLDVQYEVDEEHIQLDIVGEDTNIIIGKKGQILDALQFLLGRILSRHFEKTKPVVVDSCGYRQRRIQALKEMAVRLAEKAIKTGRTIVVNPMSAHDRRVIHMELKQDPKVFTRSEGEGASRRLLIIPD